jgi:hypothetical protein
LAAHESDAAMTEIVKMAKRQFRRPAMIEDHVRDPADSPMAGDCNHWERELVR